jgi:hypothetical protein
MQNISKSVAVLGQFVQPLFIHLFNTTENVCPQKLKDAYDSVHQNKRLAPCHGNVKPVLTFHYVITDNKVKWFIILSLVVITSLFTITTLTTEAQNDYG